MVYLTNSLIFDSFRLKCNFYNLKISNAKINYIDYYLNKINFKNIKMHFTLIFIIFLLLLLFE